MSKTSTFYVCPACGRETSEAKVSARDYVPTLDDIERRPELRPLGRERLTCPCGQVYTWFSARKVTIRDRT